jgi:hypothetical protein
MPGLTKKVLVPGAGHWIQQERPNEVNDLLSSPLGIGRRRGSVSSISPIRMTQWARFISIWFFAP